MTMYAFDKLHNHATWGPRLSHELEEEGRLHRHRVAGTEATPVFTTWAHNTSAHSHRLPDGSWSRQRTVARPPEVERQTLDRAPIDRLSFRQPVTPPVVAAEAAPHAPPITAAQALAIVDQITADTVAAEQPKAKPKRGSRKKPANTVTPDASALVAALSSSAPNATTSPVAKPKKSRGRAKKKGTEATAG